MKRFLLTSACLLFLTGPALSAAEDFKPDAEGFILNWLALDPFAIDAEKARDHADDVQKDLFDKEFIANQFKATPKANDKVTVDTVELTWKAVAAEEAAFRFATVKEDAMYLAVTYVISEVEVPKVLMSIGSDDGSCWRVNGKEVYRVSAGRAVDYDQDQTNPFTLNKGTNVISVAIINGKAAAGLSARILTADGKPVKDLKVTLTPPAP